jgi:hypothetical protein
VAWWPATHFVASWGWRAHKLHNKPYNEGFFKCSLNVLIAGSML